MGLEETVTLADYLKVYMADSKDWEDTCEIEHEATALGVCRRTSVYWICCLVVERNGMAVVFLVKRSGRISA